MWGRPKIQKETQFQIIHQDPEELQHQKLRKELFASISIRMDILVGKYGNNIVRELETFTCVYR